MSGGFSPAGILRGASDRLLTKFSPFGERPICKGEAKRGGPSKALYGHFAQGEAGESNPTRPSGTLPKSSTDLERGNAAVALL
jgi:hypothetical protein